MAGGWLRSAVIHPEPDSPGDPIAEQCLRLKRQLDELVEMTAGLEARLEDPGLSPEERGDLEALRKRYAREAVELMMRIDLLEEPEDGGDSEEEGC